MRAKITTTITTLIDLDTFTPEHSVSIECEDELPPQVVKAAVAGACGATIKTLERESEPVDS